MIYALKIYFMGKSEIEFAKSWVEFLKGRVNHLLNLE